MSQTGGIQPSLMALVDLSEKNIVELVDWKSLGGYLTLKYKGDLKATIVATSVIIKLFCECEAFDHRNSECSAVECKWSSWAPAWRGESLKALLVLYVP